MTTWLRGASLYGSGGNAGDGSAAPGRKSPRWSAERRASRVMGRAAPHSRGSVASRKRDNRNSAPVGAPPTPLLGRGWTRSKDTTRAQQRAAGTKNTALFDIVNRDDGQRFAARAATSHASCAPTLVSRASAARPGTQGRHDGSRPATMLRFASRRAGSRLSFRSASPLCTRPGHESAAASAHSSVHFGETNPRCSSATRRHGGRTE